MKIKAYPQFVKYVKEQFEAHEWDPSFTFETFNKDCFARHVGRLSKGTIEEILRTYDLVPFAVDDNFNTFFCKRRTLELLRIL